MKLRVLAVRRLARFTSHARALLSVLVLGSLAAPAFAQPRPPGNELVDYPEVWRAFRPLVIALGEGDRERAVSYLRASNRLLRKVEANLERDAPTQKFEDAASESIEELDLRGLMALLPEADGPFRRFAVQGQETPKAYRLSVGKGAFEVNATSARRGFGDSSTVWRMRRLRADDSKRYLVQWRGGAGFGQLSCKALLDGASDAIRFFEEGAVAPTGSRPLLLQAAEAQLRKTQEGLGAEDRRVLAASWASFPELAQLLATVSAGEDVIDMPRTQNGITHLRFANRFDRKRAARNYPALAEYLEDLGDLIELGVQLRDGNGNTLLTMQFDSGRMRTVVEAYVRDGGIVPSRAGHPLPDVAPRYDKMEAHVDMHGHALGIHMYVDDLRVELGYGVQPDGATLETRIRRTPGFRVEGRAFGLFPAGMLDWFIPGDIPGLARRMFEIAGKGNEGKGIVLNYRFARPPGKLASIDGQAGVELLDTALIRLGMKIGADRVIPDAAQTADIRKLAVAYRDALAKDIERFARFGMVVPVSP